MNFTFTKGTANQNFDGTISISFVVDKGQKSEAEEFYSTMANNDKPYVAKVARRRNKRSLDANKYAWLLIDRIADKTMQTRENIYREMVRINGVYADMLVNDEKANGIIQAWSGKGLGWFTEYVGDSKQHEGYSWYRFYSGSSSYDTKEMSRLIDSIVAECVDLGIETMTPAEIEKLKLSWIGV